MTRRITRPRASLDNPPSWVKPGIKKESTSERVAKLRIMDRCNPVRDRIEIIPEEHWDTYKDLHGHVKKSSRYRYTLDQDGIGSCAAESAAGIKGALDARQGFPKVVYNPWSMYWYTSGGRDNGSVIGHNVEYLRDNGICPEEVWPRSKGWRAEPGGEAKRIAKFFRIEEFFYVENTKELVSALLQGYEVHGGYSGHAVAFTQYAGRGNINFKNSWGEGWGDGGFGTLSLSRVYFPYGCYAYKYAIRFEDDWMPSMDQDQLGLAVSDYMKVLRDKKVRAGRQCNEAYQTALMNYGLVT